MTYNWMYVQAQYGLEYGEKSIWFRHVVVEAKDEREAYDKGQEFYSSMDPDAELANDYVVCL